MKGLLAVISMEFRKILAYRSDFWVTFLGQTLVQLVVARSLWQSIFEANKVESMQGFNLDMMTLYYLMVPIGARILTGQNMGFISNEIYDGTFTRYLIYPLNVFVYKSTTYLTHSFFYCLQLFFIFLIYQIFVGSLSFHPENLFFGVLIFFMASICYMLISMLIELIALWADNVWALLVMLRFFANFFGGGIIPLDFFPQWSQTVLAYTPFPYLISLPVKTLMGLMPLADSVTGLGILIAWILIFVVLLQVMWARGQKSYTGVGI